MWDDYFEKTKHKLASPLLVQYLPSVLPGPVLDLGSGVGVDSKLLTENGFVVHAVDQFGPIIEDTNFQSISFEEYEFPKDFFSLVNAQFSLPFTDPKMFNSVWLRIADSLSEGGLFIGQLFGTNDEWSNNEKMSFFTADEIAQLIEPYAVIHFEEKEYDRPTAVGKMKHWHLFELVLRKESSTN